MLLTDRKNYRLFIIFYYMIACKYKNISICSGNLPQEYMFLSSSTSLYLHQSIRVACETLYTALVLALQSIATNTTILTVGKKLW